MGGKDEKIMERERKVARELNWKRRKEQGGQESSGEETVHLLKRKR